MMWRDSFINYGSDDIDFLNCKNGLDIYGIKDKGVPIIYFQLIFKSGTILDSDEKLGLTSLLTQMLMKGNRNYPKDSLNYDIDAIGATLYIIPFQDYLSVFGKVSKNNFDKFIKIIKKVIFEQFDFDCNEFKIAKSKAKDIILNIEDNDPYLGATFFNKVVFKDGTYGRISTGFDNSLKKIDKQDILNKLTELRKSKKIVAIAGDYEDENIKKIEDCFDIFSVDKELENRLKIDIHKPKGLELYYYNKKGRKQNYIIMGGDTIRPNNKNIYALILFNKYFGADFTSILSRKIRDDNGWSYFAQTDISIYKHSATFSIEYSPFYEKTVESFKFLNNLYNDVVNDEITEEQLSFPIKKLLNAFNFKFSTILRKLNLLVNSIIYDYPEDFYKVYKDKIKILTPHLFSSIVKNIIYPKNQIVVMVGDIKPLLSDLKSEVNISKIVELSSLEGSIF